MIEKMNDEASKPDCLPLPSRGTSSRERERARDLSTHHHDELTDYILGAFIVCKMLFDRLSVSDRFPLFNYFTRTGVDDNTFDTVQWGQQTHAFREFMLKAKLRIQRFVLVYRLDPRACL